MGQTRFATGRQLDLICLGRLGVDLYAQQVGARLEDVSSFAKYLGGSSANIAFGTARLGVKTAMLSRVGDDHMGRFLIESLAREGCDVSAIKRDPERLTAIVLLGLKDRETFPLVFYRENCADMALRAEDIDEQQIASSKALLITGTHFSTDQVFKASSQALEYAEKHNVKRVLDIDYRPVLWGLAGKADGETRFVADQQVSQHVQRILPRFDLIVGTEEEFQIAGGSTDLLTALRTVRELTAATLVVKLGPQGCTVIHGAIPAHLEDGAIYPGVRVEVLNVLGAGDAFMSGFLSVAASWPMPAAVWWSPAMRAPRRCRRRPNSITCSIAPSRSPGLIRMSLCSACIRSAWRANNGNNCSSLRSITAANWSNWHSRPA